MRIANKKMFIRGIILLLLAIAMIISRFFIFDHATHGILRAIIFIGICFLASVYHLVMALHIDGDDNKIEEQK